MTDLNDAADALNGFSNGSAVRAADDLAQAFELAGERISTAFERAARSGELSFSALAENVTRDLARLAINEFVTAPLQSIVGDIGASISGGNNSAAKPPVTVNMTINSSGSAGISKQSEAQIASRLAQAVARGQSRN